MTPFSKPASDAVRPADEGIYLKEDRYQKPKEVFKCIGEVIRHQAGDGRGKAFLDVGCATGELIWYLKSQFPQATFSGIDILDSMLGQARQRMPDCRFVTGSILDPAFFVPDSADIVTCSGVLSIFDDQEVPVGNLVRCIKPGGHLVVYTIVNDDPVDVIMRYRDVREPGHPWEAGWNIFSKITYERILTSIDPGLRWTWMDFRMPFSLPKRDDPMRTWTIATERDPHQVVNGAAQLINGKILHVRRSK